MKKILIIVLIILVGGLYFFNPFESNEEVADTALENTDTQTSENGTNTDADYFGESFDTGNPQAMTTVLSSLQSSDSTPATLKVKVKDVCQAKGCWMTVDLPSGEEMRITFKDYGFFMPKDLGGKEVLINGVAKKEYTDVATLKHFAEDAGKSEAEIAEIDSPQLDYKFVASGVKML